jgi:hypothetical protein
MEAVEADLIENIRNITAAGNYDEAAMRIVDQQVDKFNEDIGLTDNGGKLRFEDGEWKFGDKNVTEINEKYLKEYLDTMFPSEAEKIRSNAHENFASKAQRAKATTENAKRSVKDPTKSKAVEAFGEDGTKAVNAKSTVTAFLADCAKKLFGAGLYSGLTVAGLSAMAAAKNGCWLMDAQLSPPSPLTRLDPDNTLNCSCASMVQDIQVGCRDQCASIPGLPRVMTCTGAACSCNPVCTLENADPAQNCATCLAGYTGTPPAACVCGDACTTCLAKRQTADCLACADGYSVFPDCNTKVPPAAIKLYTYKNVTETWDTVLGSMLNQAGYYLEEVSQEAIDAGEAVINVVKSAASAADWFMNNLGWLIPTILGVALVITLLVVFRNKSSRAVVPTIYPAPPPPPPLQIK